MKRVLVITYYWPPSGGGGVQRWLKFTKYLPQYGWEPVIYTPLDPQFENQDPSLLKDVNENVKVFKQSIKEPYQLLNRFHFKKKRSFKQGVVSEKSRGSLVEKMISWVRGNFFIPDPRISWVKPSINYLERIIREENISVIATTGPPHSMHLIGLGLKKNHNIPWIVDFRDPWSDWDMLDLFYLTKKARKIHEKMEEKVIQGADKVIAVSNAWSENLVLKFGKEVQVITNGYDLDDFRNFKREQVKEFRLLHAGLLNSFRNCAMLWEVLEEILKENLQFRETFQLVLAGNVTDEITAQIGAYKWLAGRMINLGYIGHEQLMSEYSKSSALLLLQNVTRNSDGHIPAKFFEYLATRIPIIAIGNPQSDLAELLKAYNVLEICLPEDPACLKENLLHVFNAFTQSKSLEQPKDSTAFHRHQLTKKLAELLDGLYLKSQV